MKFKIGDKVRIKKNSGSFLRDGTIGYIVKFEGYKEYALLKVDETLKITSCYGKNYWLTFVDSLELVKDNIKDNKPSNKFFFKGNKTIYYDKDGNRYCVKCCEDDVYDKKVGMLYVLAKAQGIDLRKIDELIEETKKEDINVNGKYVCHTAFYSLGATFGKGDVLIVKDVLIDGDLVITLIPYELKSQKFSFIVERRKFLEYTTKVE